MEEKAIKRVSFRYRESPSYRSFHATGAYGGLTPDRSIFMALYSQQPVLPVSSYIELGPDRKIQKEVFEDRPAGTLARVVEVGVELDLAAAVSLREWLDDKIKAIQIKAPNSTVEETK